MDPAEVVMQNALVRQKPMLEAMARGDSEIRQFYSGSTILVSGGTGFLGKLLLEKLIRACNIHKIYMLARPKKGKEIDERMNDFLKDNVFDTLREQHSDFGNKIVPVAGDVAEIRLGLSDEDWTMITEQVDFIFHLAATTRFDVSLGQATLINIRGTREMIELAKQCQKLRSFVYVSTAFSQAIKARLKTDVLEEFYPSPIGPAALIGMAESMDEDRLNKITEKLIDGWPNTYTFTKAVAEDLVRTNVGDLPACVIRPPIVLGSFSEPAPGWIDPACVYGATGWFLTIILGVNHVIIKEDVKMCVAPADFVINSIIASGRDIYARREQLDTELKIYTISSGSGCDFGKYNKHIRTKQCRSLVSPKSVWYACAHETNSIFVFWLLTWLFHYIPAYIVDGLFFLLGLKLPEGIPSAVKVYTKIYNTTLLLSYFLVNDWNFKDDNTVAMYNRMSPTDKALFNFDMSIIDWADNVIIYGLGVRKYIIKDGLKDTAYGVRKQMWFKIATYIFLPLYAYFIFKILYFFYCSIKYVI